MESKFFSLSDLLQRYRRNLLFVAVLCIVNFHSSIDASQLTFFGVKPPKNLVDVGLIICLIWFAINYAYHLYAELMQWKVEHIKKKHSRMGPPEHETLVTGIAMLEPDSIRITSTLAGTNTTRLGAPDVPLAQLVEANITQISDIARRAAERVDELLKVDIERINDFNGAVKRYHRANQARLYILDIAVPAFATVFVIIILPIIKRYGWF